MYDQVQYSLYNKREADKILDLNSYKVYDIGYIAKTEIKNKKKSAQQKWVKTRISELLVIEAEGLKVSSRFKENLEKEKASLFHLAREMKKGAECRVERLRIGGQDIDDSDICEKEVHNFFEPLFNG